MKKKIIVIGDVILDTYHYCLNRENPESSAPCYIVEKTEYKPGGAGNVAANLAKLGSRCKIISVTGEDEESSRLEIMLKHIGVESFFIRDKLRKTTVKERYLSNRDKRYHFRADFEDREHIQENHVNLILKELKNNSLIIISDYNKGTITNSLIEKIYEKGFEIAADIKPIHKNLFMNGRAKFIKPNSREARDMAGIADDLKAAEMLREELKANILLTRGKEGIVYLGKNGEIYEEKPSISTEQVVDVTGAGDSVLAVFCHFYNKGYKIKDCVKYANIAGEISVQYPGCYQVTEKEILERSKI